jgi:hypothetical protein
MDFCLKTTNLPLPPFFLLLLLDSVSCGGCFSLVGFFFVAGFSGSLFSGSLMLFMARTLGGPPDIAFPPFPLLQDAPSNASNLLFQS